MKFGLQINTSKTKVMTTTGATCQIRINEETLEQVDTFMYLGSAITRDSDCATEIRMRLAKGYAVATDLKRIWKSHDIKVTTKMELLRTLVWPVAIYGCEGWTMRKDEERRIEAFEIKCLRMIMQISWMEKRTNKWVLEKAGVERKLLGIVKERKMKYFGHIMRKEGSCLEKEIIQGTVPGGRGRGRPRINWMDNIRTWTGRTQEDLIRMTEDRRRWRNIMHDAAYPRSEEG